MLTSIAVALIYAFPLWCKTAPPPLLIVYLMDVLSDWGKMEFQGSICKQNWALTIAGNVGETEVCLLRSSPRSRRTW